jgi:branched-subunit amino acid ABC-type transport system permease component
MSIVSDTIRFPQPPHAHTNGSLTHVRHHSLRADDRSDPVSLSIGLSITFGTMHIINFAHGAVYAIGVYLFVSLLPMLWGSFPLALVAAVAAMLPLAYLVERFVIRRLYGDGIDYAIIATYAILLIGTDLIKHVWGSGPKPVSDPIGVPIEVFGTVVQTYRVVVFLSAIAVFFGLRTFFLPARHRKDRRCR